MYYYAFYAFASLSLKKGYALTAALREKLADHLKTLPLASFRKRGTALISGNFLPDMMETELVFSTYIYDITAAAFIIVLFGCTFLWGRARARRDSSGHLVGGLSHALVFDPLHRARFPDHGARERALVDKDVARIT
jgi:hypothetical protein